MADNYDGGNRIFRILDAAIDRGREALRVLEDAVRFVVDDARMTEVLKDYRHRFASLTDRVPIERRLDGRSTATDVGTSIEGAGEYERESLCQIMTANFCRLQESLRSIEEYSKMVFPEITHLTELLRYDSYTLQKELFAACRGEDFSPLLKKRMRRLDRSLLYILIGTDFSDVDFERMVRGGVDMIQLRDKTATDKKLYEAGRRFRGLLDRMKSSGETPESPLLIVNDRPDIAILVNADGVHLGQTEIPVTAVRRLIGPEMILGLSTASCDQAMTALNESVKDARVDYLGAGPVFPSTTKSFDQFPGLDYLRFMTNNKDFLVRNTRNLPIFAIGGIRPENLESVMATGIGRIAVASAVTGSSDVGRATRELRQILAKG